MVVLREVRYDIAVLRAQVSTIWAHQAHLGRFELIGPIGAIGPIWAHLGALGAMGPLGPFGPFWPIVHIGPIPRFFNFATCIQFSISMEVKMYAVLHVWCSEYK